MLDVSSSVGLTLMKWVYTDKAEIPHDEGFLIELVKAAKKYRLKELKERYCIWIIVHPGGRGGEVLTYIGYIGMCGAKGYGFFSRFGLN